MSERAERVTLIRLVVGGSILCVVGRGYLSVCPPFAEWFEGRWPDKEAGLAEVWAVCQVPAWLGYFAYNLELDHDYRDEDLRVAMATRRWMDERKIYFRCDDEDQTLADAFRAAFPLEVLVAAMPPKN